MQLRICIRILCFLATLSAAGGLCAQVAGTPGTDMLSVVRDGQPIASVMVSADAAELEKAAAADLVKYVEMMSGARLPLLAIAPGTRAPAGPAILVGRIALAEDRTLARRLEAAAKKKPILGADAIVMRRSGSRLFLAGTSDRSHYYAVARLLQDWGCRWYLPTDFGEVVPEHASLEVGALDYAHGSPFEVRGYSLSWNGDRTGQAEFQRRNFGGTGYLPGGGHALGRYTKKLVPPGGKPTDVPLAEPATAEEVAAQLEPEYARGVPGISIAIEDGIYQNNSPADRSLQARIFDKYMLSWSNTDAMITLYNNVARLLRERHPGSPTKLGGLAYSNVTLPPQRVTDIDPSIVMWLAAIDIDPNHGMDDPKSPPRQEYKGIMYRWAELLQGRLIIYDYDQGQLVWRDLPNPSHHAFAQDVRHYRNAGILGVYTESRGAMATIFLNLFFRQQLLWDPDLDVNALLAEFYPKFYGPAAAPMAEYWNAIFSAWENTLVTEHEYFVAPAIYTPELVQRLRQSLAAAQAALAPLTTKANPGRNERLYVDRLRFTELSLGIIEGYMALVRAGATDGDYARAAELGAKTLELREQLTGMNPTFTTYKKIGERGYSWFPGEVQHMRELNTLVDGTRGTLVARLPVVWAFRRDPTDTGLARGWAYTPADAQWESLRTDLYLQAQGVLMPDGQSYTGYWWYQTEMELTPAQAQGPVHVMFPGMFNDAWIYVNGDLVAHREFKEPWWRTDYRFEWDVDLTGRLKPGKNLITVRGANPHHFGGMFRRPFLYRKTAG